jgi:hypothetical protein
VFVEPNPLLRLGVLHVEPNPLLRLNEVLPGSEYDGKPLLMPPLCEHVPRPEFELYVPLLQILPAEAGATETRELAKMPMTTATKSLFFIYFPLNLNSL